MRFKSRLEEAKWLDFVLKSPILLRNCSRFTELTVLKFHQDVCHNGDETTLCKSRDIYQIIRGIQWVKSRLRKCVTCTLIQGKSSTNRDSSITFVPGLLQSRIWKSWVRFCRILILCRWFFFYKEYVEMLYFTFPVLR